MIGAAVLDIDDTLYLERDYVRSGFKAVARHVRCHSDLQGFYERAWSAFTAGIRGRVFQAVLESYGPVGDSIDISELVAVYRSHAPDITLLPDAHSFLTMLARHRIPMAAITDGPVESQRAKVQALGLEAWLDPIVLTGELGPNKGKPHPAAFHHIEDRLQFAGRNLVYIADNPLKDFKTPRALCWRTIRIRRAGGLHHEVPSGDDVDEEYDTFAWLRLDPI